MDPDVVRVVGIGKDAIALADQKRPRAACEHDAGKYRKSATDFSSVRSRLAAKARRVSGKDHRPARRQFTCSARKRKEVGVARVRPPNLDVRGRLPSMARLGKRPGID